MSDVNTVAAQKSPAPDPHDETASAVVPFDGVRLRFTSTKSFGDLVDALLADVGERPVDINAIGATFADWPAYEHEVRSHVGPSGFMLFALWDHGAWIKKAGIDRNMLRVVIGNPLIAITMIRHDVTSGLFVPVEILLTEEEKGGSARTYVVPSSLMLVEPNQLMRAAATELDAKVAALATKVTAS